MVKFTQNGMMFALIENPDWVFKQENGTYGLCTQIEAQGVAIDGTVYNLPGHSISDAGEVVFDIIESGTYIMKKNIETEQMITEQDIANIETQQAITELELMILGG